MLSSLIPAASMIKKSFSLPLLRLREGPDNEGKARKPSDDNALWKRQTFQQI